MKKIISVFLAFLFIFSAFSISSSALAYSQTEMFFNRVKEAKAIRILPPKGNLYAQAMGDVSIRLCEDEDGNEYGEFVAKTKFGADMYVLKDGMFLHIPALGIHFDYTLAFGTERTEIVRNDLTGDINKLLMIPAYENYMYFEGSEESNHKDYGKIYIETFSYNRRRILTDLVESGELVLPESLNINSSLYDIGWELIELGGKESQLGFFLQDLDEKATFVFDDNQNLIAASYYVGDGMDISRKRVTQDDYSMILPETEQSRFERPEKSFGFDLLMKIIGIILDPYFVI